MTSFRTPKNVPRVVSLKKLLAEHLTFCYFYSIQQGPLVEDGANVISYPQKCASFL